MNLYSQVSCLPARGSNSSRCCATLSVLVFIGVNEILWYFFQKGLLERNLLGHCSLVFGLVLWFASQQRSFLTSVPNFGWFDRPCLNSYLKSVKLLVVAGAFKNEVKKTTAKYHWQHFYCLGCLKFEAGGGCVPCTRHPALPLRMQIRVVIVQCYGARVTLDYTAHNRNWMFSAWRVLGWAGLGWARWGAANLGMISHRRIVAE